MRTEPRGFDSESMSIMPSSLSPSAEGVRTASCRPPGAAACPPMPMPMPLPEELAQ